MTLWGTHVYIFPSNYFQEKQVERWMRRPGYYNNFPHTSITRPTSNFSLHDCRLKYRKKFFFRPPAHISLFVATQANSVSGFKAGGVVTKIQSVDIFKIEPIEAKDCEIIQCQIGKEIEENLPNLQEILWIEKMRESQIFQFISALSDASLSASFKIIIFHDNKCLMISGKC